MGKLKTKILSSVLAVAMFVTMVVPTVWAVGTSTAFTGTTAKALNEAIQAASSGDTLTHSGQLVIQEKDLGDATTAITGKTGVTLAFGILIDTVTTKFAINNVTFAANDSANVSASGDVHAPVWIKNSTDVTVSGCNITSDVADARARLRVYGIMAESSKLTATGNTISVSAATSANPFAYGIYTRPAEAGDVFAISGNTFTKSDIEVGVQPEDKYDFNLSGSTIAGATEVYYIDEADITSADFGTAKSSFRTATSNIADFANATATACPTAKVVVANKAETKLERYTGTTNEYWAGQTGPSMAKVMAAAANGEWTAIPAPPEAAISSVTLKNYVQAANAADPTDYTSYTTTVTASPADTYALTAPTATGEKLRYVFDFTTADADGNDYTVEAKVPGAVGFVKIADQTTKVNGKANPIASNSLKIPGVAKNTATAGEYQFKVTIGKATKTVTVNLTNKTPVLKYSVTYANGGATGTAPTQEDVAKGTIVTIKPATGLTLTGKDFQHWVDGDNIVYKAGASFAMPTKPITLTAVWLETAETAAAPAVPGDGATTAITGTAGQKIVATVANTAVAAGKSAKFSLPAAGEVVNLKVVTATLANAATANPVVLEVLDSSNSSRAKWTFKNAGDVDIMVQPKVKTYINPTGLDAASAALLSDPQEVIVFSHNGLLPVGTDVEVPTALADGAVSLYKLTANGTPDLSTLTAGTVTSSVLKYSPKGCSNWVAIPGTLSSPSNPVTPPTPPTPDNSGNNTYYYGGYGYGYTQSAQESFNSTFTSRMSATARGARMTIDMADGVTLTAAQLKDAAAKGILIELKKAGKNTITIDPSKMKFSSEKYTFEDLAFLFADVADGDAVVIAPAPVAPAPVAPAPTPEATKNPQTGDNWFSNLFIGLFA